MKDLLKKEVIGLHIIITDSRNKANIGIEGKIIDETKHTLLIRTNEGKKQLMKNNITFMIKEKKIMVQGKALAGKPEERIKRTG